MSNFKYQYIVAGLVLALVGVILWPRSEDDGTRPDHVQAQPVRPLADIPSPPPDDDLARSAVLKPVIVEEADVVQIPEALGFYGRKLGEGKYRTMTGDFQDTEAVVEGAIPVFKVAMDHPEIVGAIQAPALATDEDRHQCLVDLLARTGWRATARENFIVGLQVASNGKQGKFVDVKPGSWPSGFDREAQDCYIRAFKGVTFETEAVLDVLVEYPLCINPKEETEE